MSLLLQESALSEALARLADDIDQKLDRLELDPLKDYFGEYWRYFLKYIFQVLARLPGAVWEKAPGSFSGGTPRKLDSRECMKSSLARELFREISALSLDTENQPGAEILPVKLRAILVNKSF